MTDMVVDPEITSVPTYKRLMAAGAENTHFTYIDDRPPLNRMVNHVCWPLGLNNEHNYDFHSKPYRRVLIQSVSSEALFFITSPFREKITRMEEKGGDAKL